LQFLVDFVCNEADTDVCLNAFLREVEYHLAFFCSQQ
jgi:hypothetical protein